MGRRSRRNNGGILSGIENDLGLGGGGRRGGRGNHATGGDIIHDGMKYAAIFGIAQQGLKAYSQHNSNGNNNNNNNPRDAGNGPGGLMSAPASMQQQQFQQPPQGPYQQQQRYIQNADQNQSQYPQQQQRYLQHGGENQGYYQQQQRQQDPVHDRELRHDNNDDEDAPPAYEEESPLEKVKGHQAWCNGTCGGGCMQR